MADDVTRMLNRDKVLARLARVPQFMQDAAEAQGEVEVSGLVDAMKRAARVDPNSFDPGKTAASVHAYVNPDRPLSWRIVADPKDETGRDVGVSIEQGHKAVDGSPVRGAAFFFPTYRARKPGMRRRMSAASLKAARQLFPSE